MPQKVHNFLDTRGLIWFVNLGQIMEWTNMISVQASGTLELLLRM